MIGLDIVVAQIPRGVRPEGGRHFLFELGPYGILIIQIVIIVLTIIILWWLLKSRAQSKYDKSDTPLDILKKRYAAGEITKKEYEQIKKELE